MDLQRYLRGQLPRPNPSAPDPGQEAAWYEARLLAPGTPQTAAVEAALRPRPRSLQAALERLVTRGLAPESWAEGRGRFVGPPADPDYDDVRTVPRSLGDLASLAALSADLPTVLALAEEATARLERLTEDAPVSCALDVDAWQRRKLRDRSLEPAFVRGGNWLYSLEDLTVGAAMAKACRPTQNRIPTRLWYRASRSLPHNEGLGDRVTNLAGQRRPGTWARSENTPFRAYYNIILAERHTLDCAGDWPVAVAAGLTYPRPEEIGSLEQRITWGWGWQDRHPRLRWDRLAGTPLRTEDDPSAPLAALLGMGWTWSVRVLRNEQGFLETVFVASVPTPLRAVGGDF